MTIFSRILFTLFALYEGFAGYVYLTNDAAAMNELFVGINLTDEAMRITRGFGLAITTFAIISLACLFIKDRLALLSISVGFAFYNLTVAYLCFYPGFVTDSFRVPSFIHSTLLVLFLVNIIFLLKRRDWCTI